MGKVNTTRIGRKWEKWAHKNLFPGSKLMTKDDYTHPYDINFDGARINVKASQLYQKKHGKYFEFLLKQTHEGCDYFLCVGYQKLKDKDPIKVWLIPSSLLTDKYRLTIGPNHRGQWKDFEREFIPRTEREAV